MFFNSFYKYTSLALKKLKYIFNQKNKKNLDNIITVGIEASRENRFNRLAQRGREDDPDTFDDFVKREERELGWGLKEAIDDAQIKLNNDSSLKEFRQLCMSTLSAIRDRGPKTL